MEIEVLAEQLNSENPDKRDEAHQALLMLDEDALEPLSDVYYRGVTEEHGIAILKLMAEIGGPTAMHTLREVFHFEERKPTWKRTAAEGLIHNEDSLSPHELEDLHTYLKQ